MCRVVRCLLLLICLADLASSLPAQQVTLSGLRALNGAGAFHGLRQDASGNLYTLFAAGDGVRVLEFSPDGTALLAQTHIGQMGDTGIALDLDPAGNIYVAGTSDSRGSLAGTTGTAFSNRSGTRTNSFVAKFAPGLTLRWLTFCGAEPMAVAGIAVTPNAVLITGSIFQVGDANNALPVTSGGIQQSPAPASTSDGFVESFSPSTGALQYATYLTGANGATSPAAIVADSAGNAYIAGTTTATGFPTTNALVPVFRSTGGNATGFVTKLSPAGDGFVFSTFVPGNGLTGLALDSGGSALLLSGDVAAGLFPLTEVQAPIAPLLHYQTAVRMALDGSSVLSSTLLAPGTESVIAPGASGTAWVFGSSQTSQPPLLPLAPLETLGNAFAVRIAANGTVDRAARLGGLPTANSGYASLLATEGGVAALQSGSVALAGNIAPTLSSSLLSTEHYDLPLVSAPTAALPSGVRDALPPASCSGSACSGGAGLLATLAPDASAPGLALSTDDLPNLVLRNLGTAAASGLTISAAGYSQGNNCATSLAAGAECSIALTGSGPGSITVAAANAPSSTTTLPATTLTANSIAVLPREIDFGLQTSGSAVSSRTLNVTNLGHTSQTFASKNSSSLATPYTITETATTCTPAGDGVSKVLAPGGSCTITLGLTASSNGGDDGAISAHWQVGSSDVLLTGYAQAAAETLSATTIDFGRQFAGGLRAARHLYVSNASDTAKSHSPVASTNAAFTAVDECPEELRPRSVCRIVLGYNAPTSTASDVMTLYVDGMTATVLGETLPQPSLTGSSSNPNLSVSSSSVVFASPATATTVSPETHTVVISNTGAAPFALALAIAGDYSYQTSCPATLAAKSNCNVVVSFTPSGAGTRNGLLSVTAGSSGPVYVALTGSGTDILPAGSSSVSFGDVPLNTPSVLWFKVSQTFVSLTAASSDADFKVLLVEDTGYGHGDPPASAFTGTAAGSCVSCYLGVQFLAITTGAHSGTVSLTSSAAGKPLTLSTSGNGTSLSGLVLTPVAQDFGPVPVHSSSAPIVFQLTNGTSSSVGAQGAAVTGDFALSGAVTGGATCANGSIAPGASCFVPVSFSPSAIGTRAGTLTVATSAGQVSSTVGGTGTDDPGIAFAPGELRFDNVPDASATRQTVTLTNTGSASETISTPVVSDGHFAANSTCGALSPGASCTIAVTYTPGTALASGTLTVPVTTAPAGAPSTTVYAIALSGLYTTSSAGLQIVPGEHIAVNFGASATGAPALSRVLHVNNLTAKAMNLSVDTPREFALTRSGCGTLAANASCDLTVQYTPLTAGDTTGTLFLTGTPSDGSAPVTGLGYLEGYGIAGSSALSISGAIAPMGVLDFGQVASGQSASQTLTLTNPATSAAGTAITVRRVLSEFPYTSTTTCGHPLTPGQSCSITITYSPVFQAAAGSNLTSTETDAGVLTILSDGAGAPQFVDLNGTATPAFVTTPNNAAPVAAFTTSQGSLFFGDQAAGSASAAQSVTLNNTGTATVHITGVLAPAGYSVSSGCSTLVSGGACTLQVSFAPQALGAALGGIEIQSDASNSLEMISVLGNGVTPTTPPPAGTASASIAPLSIDFGRVQVNTAVAQAATLTNTGTLPVTVTSIAISGDQAFSLPRSGGTPCPGAGGTLAAGSSCTVAVAFTPASTGTLRGTLTVVTSASSVPLTVALSGVGTQPLLSAAPTSLSFGDVAVGSTAALSLTLANSGNLAVDGLAFSATSGFSVSSTCGITTLNAASSCAVTVTFAPNAAGPVNGTLTIRSTDPASPLIVPLTGSGVQATAASLSTLTATPASLSFGSVAIGSNSTVALVLSNATAVPANALLFTASAGFSVSNGCGAALNAYSTCPVVVTFAPASAGPVTGTLTVQSSSTTTPLVVALTGTGTSAQPQLTLMPNSLAFGSVSLGSSSSLSLTLTNSSGSTVNAIALAASAGFTIGGSCGANLGPGSSCPIVITFTPTSAGVTAGTLKVSSSDPASPIVAALSGTGVATGSFLLTVDGSSSSTATVQSGAPASYSLLVTPTGGYTGTVDLTCGADTPIANVACSLVPPSVTLGTAPQGSIATINTVSAVDQASAQPAKLRSTALWCLSPAMLVLLLRRKRPAALLALFLAALFSAAGCGSGGDPRIRYAATGTYSFHVTATSTAGPPITQTVTLTLVVKPKP